MLKDLQILAIGAGGVVTSEATPDIVQVLASNAGTLGQVVTQLIILFVTIVGIIKTRKDGTNKKL